MRIAELIDREAEAVSTRNGVASSRAARPRRAARRRALRAHHARAPGRRRARLARRDAAGAVRAGQGRGLLPVGGRVPAALRVPLPRAAAARHVGARRRRGPHRRSSWTAATSTATRRSSSSTAARILNIDHHHDNTRFGTVDHVVPDASCTAEVIWDLMRGARRRAHPADRRGALRRARDRHRQVHVREHRPARARDGGRPDRRRASTSTRSTGGSTRACRRASSSCSPAGSAPSSASTAGCSRSPSSRARTTRVTGADESYSEGVVDHLRAVEGTAVAGPGARAARPDDARADARRKVSLRATDDRIDVSAIARALGGGGHRRAAGFSTDMEFARARRVPARPARAAALSRPRTTASCWSTSPPGSPRTTWWPRSGGGCRAGRKVGHAGTLDPFATGLLLVLIGRATRVQRFLMALPKRYETVARLGWTSTTGDPEGEIAPGRTPAEPLALPTGRIRQRPPAYSAVQVGGRRAYALARAGRGGRAARARGRRARASTLLWRDGERAAFAIECGSGTYVRSLIADLGDAYCLELRRTGDRAVRRRRRRPLRAARTTRSGSCPRSRWRATTRAAPGTAWRCPATAGTRRASCGSSTRDGLIALAEPRGDGTLKPVVGFRG